MAVTFNIPGPLLSLTNGNRSVQLRIRAKSVREALGALFEVYPGVRDRILTEQEIVREHVNLFVGREDIRYLDGLETRLPDSVEISIVPAVSGG